MINYGESLGTPKLGMELNKIVVDSINNGRSVIIDFEGLEVVSGGFAYQFIGKLFELMPEETTAYVKIINTHPFVTCVLRRVCRDAYMYGQGWK
jgi:hypothetical protein